jgi:5-methylcytosine-specific restriction endonuclease McrA
LRHPHPLSATLDHIIPLLEGGTHTRQNAQLAHKKCNASKNASPHCGSQLRLIA